MYIIEMHYEHRAFAQIILEKGDAQKSYAELCDPRIIINHVGTLDEKCCSWCLMNRLKTRRKEREA